MKPWKTLQSKELYHAGFFRLRQDECELGDGRIMPRYYVVEFPDWVHVVAMTKSRELIMVRQYRHAGKCECLELPGAHSIPGILKTPWPRLSENFWKKLVMPRQSGDA